MEARAWTGDVGSPGHVLYIDSAIPLKVEELPRVWWSVQTFVIYLVEGTKMSRLATRQLL